MNLTQYVGKVVRTRPLERGAWQSWACIAAVGHSLRLCQFGEMGGLEEWVDRAVADNCGAPICQVEVVGEMADEDKRFVGLADALLMMPPGEWTTELTMEIPGRGQMHLRARAWGLIRTYHPGTRLEDVRDELDRIKRAEGAVNSDEFGGQKPGWLLITTREVISTPAGGYAILTRLVQRKTAKGWSKPIMMRGGGIAELSLPSVRFCEVFGEPVRLSVWGFQKPAESGPTEGVT